MYIAPPLSEAFAGFWDKKGDEVVAIAEIMTGRDMWAMDRHVADRLDSLYYAIQPAGFIERRDELMLADIVTLSSWLSSRNALALLGRFDEVAPGIILEMMESERVQALGGVFSVFIERITAFSRLRLIGDLFSYERMRKMERLLIQIQTQQK